MKEAAACGKGTGEKREEQGMAEKRWTDHSPHFPSPVFLEKMGGGLRNEQHSAWKEKEVKGKVFLDFIFVPPHPTLFLIGNKLN